MSSNHRQKLIQAVWLAYIGIGPGSQRSGDVCLSSLPGKYHNRHLGQNRVGFAPQGSAYFQAIVMPLQVEIEQYQVRPQAQGVFYRLSSISRWYNLVI